MQGGDHWIHTKFHKPLNTCEVYTRSHAKYALERYLLRVGWEREVYLVQVHAIGAQALQSVLKGIMHGLRAEPESPTQQEVCPRNREVLGPDHYVMPLWCCTLCTPEH